jgi:hypothetical protein
MIITSNHSGPPNKVSGLTESPRTTIAEKPFAPYAIAGASTLLLIAGVYGAWDLTLWMVTNRDKT